MFRSIWAFIRFLFTPKIYEVLHHDSPGMRVYVRRCGFWALILDPSFAEVFEHHLTEDERIALQGYETVPLKPRESLVPVEYRWADKREVGFIAQDLAVAFPDVKVESDKRMMSVPVDDVLKLLDKAEAENPAEFGQRGLQALRDHLTDRNTRYYALPHHLRPELLHM